MKLRPIYSVGEAVCIESRNVQVTGIVESVEWDCSCRCFAYMVETDFGFFTYLEEEINEPFAAVS